MIIAKDRLLPAEDGLEDEDELEEEEFLEDAEEDVRDDDDDDDEEEEDAVEDDFLSELRSRLLLELFYNINK